MFANIPLTAIAIAMVIFSFQLFLFFRSWQKIVLLRGLFPDEEKLNGLEFRNMESDKGSKDADFINLFFPPSQDSENIDFRQILHKTNKYLDRCAGNIVDYELIKEIAESEYDKLINEIELNLPRPLYMGLMGTFLGVILGISEIIGAGQLDTNNLSAIIPFLSHIITAMIASLFGLGLTSFSTNKLFKSALKKADGNKNEYLNIIKYELLPKLNKGVSDILLQVAKSLTKFNNSFTVNIEYFGTVFNSANDNINRQLEFVQRFEKLKIDSVLNNIDGIAQNIIKANRIFENFGQVAEKLDHSAKVYEGLVDKSRSVMEELGFFRDGVQALLSVTETYKANSSTLKEAAYFFNSQHDIFDQVLAKFQAGLVDLIDGYKNDLSSKQLSLVEKRDELLRHFDIAMDQLKNNIPAGKLEKLDQLDKMYEAIKTLYAEAMQNAETRSQKLNTEVVSTLKSLDKNINVNLEKLSKKLDKRSYEPHGTHTPPIDPIPNTKKAWNKPTKQRWISWMRDKFNFNKNK